MRRRVLPALAACLAATSSCDDPLAPASTGAPAALTYATAGFLSVYTTVRLDGAAVVTVRTRYDGGAPVATETRRVPSAAEWQAFRAAVRAAGVSRWPRECGDRGVADGGGFKFTLVLDGTSTAGLHVNAFPRAGGGCAKEYTDEARRFEDAVATVAGVDRLTGP
jgi:hypothetical protein